MKRIILLVFVTLATAVATLSCGPPEAQVLIENETGVPVEEVALDYGVGRLEFLILCEGCTHSGVVDVSEPRTLTLEWVDGTRTWRKKTLTKQLDVSMGGKNAIIRLEADGTVKELY